MINNLSKSLFSKFNIISQTALKNNLLRLTLKPSYPFTRGYKIITDPKDVSKLIFDDKGKCKIFEHKNGEFQLKWIVRVITSLTVFNSVLTGLQFAYPIFGTWNQFSFSIFAGMGYLSVFVLSALSKRAIHRINLCKDLETVDVEFFNAFWKPQTINFHISEFQDPTDSYFGFIRVDLTSIGKVWIKLEKNEFRRVKDYEETLDSVLLGKPLTNLNIAKKK